MEVRAGHHKRYAIDCTDVCLALSEDAFWAEQTGFVDSTIARGPTLCQGEPDRQGRLPECVWAVLRITSTMIEWVRFLYTSV